MTEARVYKVVPGVCPSPLGPHLLEGRGLDGKVGAGAGHIV